MRTAIRARRSDHSEDPTVEVVQQGLADEAPFGRVGVPGERGRTGEGFFLDLVKVHAVLLPARARKSSRSRVGPGPLAGEHRLRVCIYSWGSQVAWS